MRGLFASFSLIIAVFAGLPARASSADWFVIATGETGKQVELMKGGSNDALLALVPRRVFITRSDIVVIPGKYAIPAGTLFIQVDSDGSGKVCAMARHLGSAFNCLADQDNDGRFEWRYGQQVFNEFYFGSRFKDESFTLLPQPASLVELDPFKDIAPVRTKLTYASGSPAGKMRFRLCIAEPSGAAAWPKGAYKNLCISQIYVADGAEPAPHIDVFGIKLNIRPGGEKSVIVSVDPAVRRTMATFGGRTF